MTVAGIIIATSVYKPATRLPWYLFAVGFFLFACGDIYTYILPRLFGVEVPFPSWGDLMYVLVYPVQMAGLMILVRRRNPGTDRSGVVDSLIITLGLSLLVWVFAIAPNLHAEDLTTLQKIVSVAYPMGDILLLAAIVRLSVGGGSRQPAFYFLASSVGSPACHGHRLHDPHACRQLRLPEVARLRLDAVPAAVGRRGTPPVDEDARRAVL